MTHIGEQEGWSTAGFPTIVIFSSMAISSLLAGRVDLDSLKSHPPSLMNLRLLYNQNLGLYTSSAPTPDLVDSRRCFNSLFNEQAVKTAARMFF